MPAEILTGVSFLSPTRSTTGTETSFSGMDFHPGASRNSGKRSFGFNSRLASCFTLFGAALLLICAQARYFPPLGAFIKQRDEVFHEGEFLFTSSFPVQPERFHQVG